MSPATRPARFGRASGSTVAIITALCWARPGRMLPPARERELLRGDADIGPPHPAVPHQFAEHEIGRVRRNREADALRAHDDRGVDADNLAVRGDQRTAGIAGIERGVGLDHVVDQPARARPQRAPERRDHAGSHRRFEAERIADGDHQLAALEQLGIAERRRRQRHRGVDAHQREVGVGIVCRRRARSGRGHRRW